MSKIFIHMNVYLSGLAIKHVASIPMMKTFFLAPMPSISVRIWLMTRSAAPPASDTEPPRDFAMESSSSKNRTHGEAERACGQRHTLYVPRNKYKTVVV